MNLSSRLETSKRLESKSFSESTISISSYHNLAGMPDCVLDAIIMQSRFVKESRETIRMGGRDHDRELHMAFLFHDLF